MAKSLASLVDFPNKSSLGPEHIVMFFRRFSLSYVLLRNQDGNLFVWIFRRHVAACNKTAKVQLVLVAFSYACYCFSLTLVTLRLAIQIFSRTT